MKKIFYNFIIALLTPLFILMANGCAKRPHIDINDYISMHVKEITYSDKNYLVTIELSNISSKTCEIGDSSASLNYTKKYLRSVGIMFSQGNRIYAAGYSGELFKILPKQTITVKIPLEVVIRDNNNLSKERSLMYLFTHMQIGESTCPQFGFFELSAPIMETGASQRR